jgi:hypothetical protein
MSVTVSFFRYLYLIKEKREGRSEDKNEKAKIKTKNGTGEKTGYKKVRRKEDRITESEMRKGDRIENRVQ